MKLQIAANAKINLTLHITGKLDNGYHTLDMVMQSVGLQDQLTLTLTDTPAITVTCSDDTLNGEDNLAFRAAQSFFDKIDNRKQGVTIYIEKHIPLAGGLGGGSADAAAVLLGLNHLFCEPLTLDELKELALPLGADVPFCLVGGTCRATGIGENLEPLQPVQDGYVLLVKPCEKESTGKMYQKYDEIKGLQAEENCVIISKMWSSDLADVAKNLTNDFLPLYEQREIPDTLNALVKGGALGASLSGSGPTVFGLFYDEETAKQCAAQPSIQNRDHWIVPICHEGTKLL